MTTVAGCGTPGHKDGAGDTACFFGPWDVAVDESGAVIVADRLNYRIRRIGLDGVCLHCRHGDVADYGNECIRRIE